jgi:hypothetical protein
MSPRRWSRPNCDLERHPTLVQQPGNGSPVVVGWRSAFGFSIPQQHRRGARRGMFQKIARRAARVDPMVALRYE